MKISFDRWEKIQDTYEKWWKHELGRPVANLYVTEPEDLVAERHGPPPTLSYTRFTGRYPADVPARDIIECYDYELASRRYVADGFPSTWPNYGAGVLAAMTGCQLNAREDTIWFEPARTVPSPEFSIPAGTDSEVARRIAEFYTLGSEYWGSTVQLGMTDLGGTMDVLQSFFPSAGLSLELYDNPNEIARLIRDVHESWWNHFHLFRSLVSNTTRGYSAWTPLLSQASYYMLQCDFAYMIGPDMFSEFALPELRDSCARLERPFYHLDGDGQLAHLDKILAIPNLAGVQWIPGDGAPDTRNWPEVYQKIRDAGKLTQLFLDQSVAGIDVLDTLATQLGSLENFAVVGAISAEDEPHAREVLQRHGIPW
jgi:hypothetical protein